MRKFFILIFTMQTFCSFAQVQSKSQKVEKILEPQSFYLNGGTKSMVGGNSRIGFKVDLPLNTIEWYYAFTTEPNKNAEQNIQLENQLSFLLQTAGFSENLINLIKIPAGPGLIDVYLTNRKGYDVFFEKDVFGMWKYIAPGYSIEGSRTNIGQGKVMVDDIIKGSHFLVIRNTSATTGINVKLEVVAIVEEAVTDYNLWDKKTKDALFKSLRADMKQLFTQYNEDQIDEITGCVMTKFTSDLKPAEVSTLAEYELKAVFKKYISQCSQ